MRSSLRKRRALVVTDNEQYCAFCATVTPFERVEPSDYPVDEPDEWICITCGSALLVDPPTQPIHLTA
ncbi:hypothetical protein GCM10009630_72860 [Kribbella jejuensis]|uniref:Uncharacterized protein n=1 Tax=Kribbella jejuensis TaxID=236068 RepID=A0A542E8X2_9ACTN|nr:hypothetical protein [Kribbella jejuensis]TQJ11757.1 hypothetical protein FB475_4680 [Kribbella jejuensis]